MLRRKRTASKFAITEVIGEISSRSSRACHVTHVTERHRALGEDADLNAIAERIIAVRGIVIGLVPRDLIWIGPPVSFPTVEAFKDLRVTIRAGAKVDVWSFEALSAALRYLVHSAQNQKLPGLRHRQSYLSFARHLIGFDQAESLAIPRAGEIEIGDLDPHVADAPKRHYVALRREFRWIFSHAQ